MLPLKKLIQIALRLVWGLNMQLRPQLRRCTEGECGYHIGRGILTHRETIGVHNACKGGQNRCTVSQRSLSIAVGVVDGYFMWLVQHHTHTPRATAQLHIVASKQEREQTRMTQRKREREKRGCII